MSQNSKESLDQDLELEIKKDIEDQEVTDEQVNEEEQDEDFELLCNQAEAEEMKQQRKNEVKQMNKKMDQKLNSLLAEKKQNYESQAINEVQDMKEENSGLLIKKGSRRLNSDEVEAYVNGRKFVQLEDLDKNLQKKDSTGIKAFFTVGVIFEIGRIQTSKNNKTFCTMKLTDLTKYDLFRAKQQLAQEYKNDKEGLKIAEKSINNNGYKIMKLMLFNDIAQKAQNFYNGAVVGVINPKPLKASLEYGYSYCVDLEPQIFSIGTSEEFAYCRYIGKEARQCYTFLNKSVEKICETHRFLEQQEQMMRMKANRQVMNSEYLDINSIRKQHSIMLTQQNIGAFGSSFGRKKQKSAPLSPKTQARLQEQRQKERDQYNEYLKSREDRNQKKNHTQAHFKNLQCYEKSHLNKSAYDNPASIIEKKFQLPKVKQAQNKSEDEEDGLEFIGNQSDKQGNTSLKQALNLNRKMLFNQRFEQGTEEKIIEQQECSKRKKID